MQYDIKQIIENFIYDPNSVKKNYDGKTDIYLAKASYRYAYVKRILIAFLILVVIAFVLSGNISYSKFYYLIKDVKLSYDYVNTVHDTITYNVGNSQSYIAYRSGIAVASREKLSIFTSGGRELYSSNHSYGNPAMVANDKYVLLYDVGGTQGALYNSFTKVDEKILDHPIYGACVSQSGSYALITRSDKYDSVVRVFQSNGKEYAYNFFDGRVYSASLSKNGLQLVVLLVISDADEIRTEIRSYKLGSSDYTKKELTFSGIPYEVRVLNSGNIIAVGANGVNAFGPGLSLLGEYLSDQEIYAYDFGEDNIAIAHASDNKGKTDLVILNKRGKTEKHFESGERVMSVALYNGYLFTQKLGGFERTNIALGINQKIDMIGTGFKMIVSDKNTLIVCNESYAKFLNFK